MEMPAPLYIKQKGNENKTRKKNQKNRFRCNKKIRKNRYIKKTFKIVKQRRNRRNVNTSNDIRIFKEIFFCKRMKYK